MASKAIPITSKIQDAAPRNKELLAVLSETDYATPSLEQRKRYISELETELQQTRSRIVEIDKKREKELQEHVKYRDSVMKRFACKVSHETEKFEAKATKEEQEYFEVMQEEQKAKEMERGLEAMKNEAVGESWRLGGLVDKHTQAKKDLENLYNSIFKGPTPDFPENDERDKLCEDALEAYHELRVKLESESGAARLLSQAQQQIHHALMSIEDALDHSRMEILGGGTFNDMMERNCLHYADRRMSQMQMLVIQARRMSPQVGNLPTVKIAQGNIISDVIFDNIFTDMAFHDRIKDSRAEVQMCANVLQTQHHAAMNRQMQLQEEIEVKSRILDNSRSVLQNTRHAIFEQSANASEASSNPFFNRI